MTALAKQLGLFQATDLTISIAAPTATMALNVRLSEQLGKEHFSIDVTLIEAPTPRESAKSREGGGEPRRPERDPEGDVYGENGERMPYYPARPSQSRSGEVAGNPLRRGGVRDPVC
jgi:hypothetical protein